LGASLPAAEQDESVRNPESYLRTADCFRLLATCFYVPAKTALVEENLCGNLAALFGQVCPGAERFAREMDAALRETSEEDLRVDHANLFLGPFELRAPPYGSVYLEQTSRLMGDSTMKVQAAYRESGLDLVEREAPDHIAIELEFMHFLWDQAFRAAQEGNQEGCDGSLVEAYRFLKGLMLPWVPEFCRRIRESAQTGFYLNLAECLERYVVYVTGQSR
jgi:TorA maturation chaperone TorD